MPTAARSATEASCQRSPAAERGTGLSTYRWVIERGFALLCDFRFLPIRWRRRTQIQAAPRELACCLIIHLATTNCGSRTQPSSVTAA